MKKILNILYKGKSAEERPKLCVIKTQSTVTPNEQLTYEQWAKENKVGIAIEHRQGIYNAISMMKLWDERTMCSYIKKRNMG